MEQYVSEQEHETPEVDPTLEDQYGEPNDGPAIEEDPRLDAEVTDERTDAAMGLDDTEDGGVTSADLSFADAADTDDEDALAQKVARCTVLHRVEYSAAGALELVRAWNHGDARICDDACRDDESSALDLGRPFRRVRAHTPSLLVAR